MKNLISITVAFILLASCASTIKIKETESDNMLEKNYWFVYRYEKLYGIYSAKCKIPVDKQKEFGNEKYFYIEFPCDTTLHFGDSIQIRENKFKDVEVVQIKRKEVKNRTYKF